MGADSARAQRSCGGWFAVRGFALGRESLPFVYQLVSNTVLNRFNIVTKAWGFGANLALAGTFGAGAASVFAPSRGVEGTIAAGATTTSVVLSTALPTAVGLNMLANRGGSGEYGFKLRILGKADTRTAWAMLVRARIT